MTGNVTVPPVVMTCAVRYALTRSSYIPSMISEQVRACWADLGGQQRVIIADIRNHLEEAPSIVRFSDQTWTELLEWAERQTV